MPLQFLKLFSINISNRTVKKDTSSAHNERLPRRMAQTEDVVAADAVLERARDLRVVRAPAHGDQDVFRRQLLLGSILQRRHNRMRVFKLPKSIDILDLLIPKVNPCDPIDRFDVILNGFCEGGPVYFDSVDLRDFPAV